MERISVNWRIVRDEKQVIGIVSVSEVDNSFRWKIVVTHSEITHSPIIGNTLPDCFNKYKDSIENMARAYYTGVFASYSTSYSQLENLVNVYRAGFLNATSFEWTK